VAFQDSCSGICYLQDIAKFVRSFSFAPESATSFPHRLAYNGTCYSDVADIIVTEYNNGSIVGTPALTFSTSGAQAYALMMDGFAATKPTSLATNSTTITYNGNTGRHLSGGVIAGIVVGSILVLISGRIFLWHLRLSHRSKTCGRW
jgi:hypothetical protein